MCTRALLLMLTRCKQPQSSEKNGWKIHTRGVLQPGWRGDVTLSETSCLWRWGLSTPYGSYSHETHRGGEESGGHRGWAGSREIELHRREPQECRTRGSKAACATLSSCFMLPRAALTTACKGSMSCKAFLTTVYAKQWARSWARLQLTPATCGCHA